MTDPVSVELERLIEELTTNKAVFDVLSDAAVVAQIAYESFDEPKDVSVDVDYRNLTLSASGEGVGFAEFGTGVYAAGNEFSSQVKYDTSPGSYSATEGTGQFAKHGFWYFRGKRLVGQAGTNAMQKAKESIERALPAMYNEYAQ